MTSQQVVEAYYSAFTNQEPQWKEFVSETIKFWGPLQQTETYDEFVAVNEQFLPLLKDAKLLRRTADAKTVCSEFEYTVNTPSGGELVFRTAEFAEVVENKITSFTLYYDPTAFAKAFNMG